MNFEFERKDGTSLILNERFILHTRKKGVSYVPDFHEQIKEIYVEKPLTELKKGAILKLANLDEMTLTGCYIDLEEYNLCKELGIDIPSQRIF